ncbi:uncharacterized protein LOC133524815 [Cydia pomonella]|uniref:uncharacterized protein LOC133520775 n=1 Tax=Cydia pomonella TaxID=82600 RepID=UPI002ADDA825|nr:uncharacterized protein LOC133520775 [Cydia pomonella]XP_061716946.1 uncharacterized protein LOC133524815 [Cydia pomonella]
MAKRFVRVFIRAIFHVIFYIWRPLIKMEILRKERGIARRLFTTAKNEFQANLESTNIDEITAAFNKLQLRADSLFNVDLRIKEQWLKTDEMTEDEIYEDCMTSDKYLNDWERIKVMYENVSRKNERMKRSCKSSGSDVSNNTQKSHQCCEKSACNSACHSRRFRLPKFELRKFDGNTKNWIGFWCQFQKIDDDETIDDGDKFQYLYQCTVPDTPAREIVESFPPSGDNYKKAVEQLKSRFARDEMLIDIYVRELLNLVLAQAKVESALPESVLRAWQRSHVLEEKGDDHLNQLMQFLKREVESEERIQLARTEIASGDSLHSVSTQPTAACMVSTEDAGKKICCVWCEKASHSSFECYKANKMSYEARKEMLNKKGACLICLKTGHNAKRCKNFTKCLFCSKCHSVLMCPDIKMSSQNETEKTSNVETSNLNNNVTQYKASTTLLQTFMANIMTDKKCIRVRCFIDSGAQKTYLRRDIIENLDLKPVGKEIVSNCLFGGIETKTELFHTYELKLASLDKKFECTMTARDKSTLCGYVPRLNVDHEMFKELQKYNITLSDVGDAAAPDIGLLIGADHAGVLLTESFLKLNNNLVAIKTKFGWTLQGPVMNTCSLLMNVVLENEHKMKESKKVVLANNTADYSTFLSTLTFIFKYITDLAGLSFLRSGGKVWIILFMCAVYRAVHIKFTKPLMTEAFLIALRRFIPRRGRVDTKYTDNSNFHEADNLLMTLNVRNIKRKFSSPAAPWRENWWERLIRSLKDLMKRNLPCQFHSDEQAHSNENIQLLIQRGKERDSNLRVGDVVLIKMDTKRTMWLLGRIVETFSGTDGCVRVAKMRTTDGEFTRAVQRLYPREAQAGDI